MYGYKSQRAQQMLRPFVLQKEKLSDLLNLIAIRFGDCRKCGFKIDDLCNRAISSDSIGLMLPFYAIGEGTVDEPQNCGGHHNRYCECAQ